MRTYSGHSSAAASNELYRTNLAKGQTGLSVACDLPTQTGYDPDHPLARGEVGKVGVPVSHLGDQNHCLGRDRLGPKREQVLRLGRLRLPGEASGGARHGGGDGPDDVGLVEGQPLRVGPPREELHGDLPELVGRARPHLVRRGVLRLHLGHRKRVGVVVKAVHLFKGGNGGC